MDCCFIFSGQGSHRPGMGINLYEHSSIAKSKIDLADSVLGYKISQIMFNDNEPVLKKTIMFITHDFDEALRLADRIAIMKDGIIEQLDTPANIVLSPATAYVKKFTQEVPREKVLKIESVMEPMSDNKNLSDLKVSKDAIIETVAEKILSQEKPVAVIDSNKKVVGIVKPSKVVHTVFGGKKENS